MSWFLLNSNLTPLEPYDWKLSCTVLRGEGSRKGADLPGWKGKHCLTIREQTRIR